MTPFRAIRLVGEVAKGLDYAHQRNVVHHDVKPANVLLSGTVTLVEKWSGTVRFGAAAMKHFRLFTFQAMTVAVTSRQTVKRSAISARHSGAVSRCRPGRKCGEMPLNADKNRCACPGDVNRFIARSRCLVG